MSDEAKLTGTYTFRLPRGTKELLDRLPPEHKYELNRRLRLETARKLHEMAFNPKQYLGD
jgi:hypothetical protein